MPGTTFAQKLAIGITVLWMVTWVQPSWGLDTSRDATKYGHTVWRNLDGFAAATIGPIAQTSDGYLWLGTPTGLLRFDGIRSVRWSAPSGSALPDERVRALFGSRDGTLWIGTPRGLASWKDGQLSAYPLLKGRTVNAIEEDADGAIWVGGSGEGKAFLCSISEGKEECHGAERNLGGAILALYRDTSGNVWAAGQDKVWKFKSKPTASFSLPNPIGALRTMTGTADGTLVVGARGTILTIANGEVQAMQLPSWTQGLLFTKALQDRDGGLWVSAADFGLLHFHANGVTAFTSAEGLSGDHVLGLFEDREGNVWVSTSHGLDRFRPMAAAVYSRRDGFKGRVASLLTARDGSVWASTSTTVYRLSDGKVTAMRPSRSATLFEDRRGRLWTASQYDFGYFEGGRFLSASVIPAGTIDGIGEHSKQNIWVAHREAGLLSLSPDDSVQRLPWSAIGKFGRVSTLIIDPTDDSIWLGLWSGDVVNVRDGTVQTSFHLDEPGSRGVVQLRVDPDGAVWAVSRAGLYRFHRGRLTKLGRDSGLPCDGAHWTLLDERTVSIYSPCGLIQLDRDDVNAWSAAADQGMDATLRVRMILDQWDGVGQPSNVSAVGQIETVQLFTPKAARAEDGRLWIVTGDGIVAVDPTRIPTNDQPPPVHIEQVSSDGETFEATNGLTLPPLQRNLQIAYAGLSLTLPERVKFRYKLEGWDADWQEAGTRRQAFYTDLSPGHYRFRVIAANANGVWNRAGDTLEFSIEPAWWQTNIFRGTCAASIALLLFVLYRLRIAQLSKRLSLSLDARVDERLRIARELHDTLLQSFQGLLLRLQTAYQLLPSGDGRRILGEGIDQAADAITEGRDAVQGLRTTATETGFLEDAIRAMGQALASNPDAPKVRFSVEVEGRTRTLHPIMRDEVFRIVAEALRNAYRHAHPTVVVVTVHYGVKALQVRIRDNGEGMDRIISRRGRDGHFGLPGMRERAKLLDGKLVIWSRLNAGTAVELAIPATRAYSMGAGGLER